MEHDKSLNFDDSIAGYRIQLIRTSDPWTHLMPGDTGIAVNWNNAMGRSVLFVKWDRGGSMGLIEGVDEWKWLSKYHEA